MLIVDERPAYATNFKPYKSYRFGGDWMDGAMSKDEDRLDTASGLEANCVAVDIAYDTFPPKPASLVTHTYVVIDGEEYLYVIGSRGSKRGEKEMVRVLDLGLYFYGF